MERLGTLPSREATETEREEILNKLQSFVSFAVENRQTVLKTNEARVLIDTDKEKSLVYFYYYPNKEWEERLHFWMNASSVRSLGEELRKHPERRTLFEEIANGKGSD